MEIQNHMLQFIFLPHLAQGHMIPMIDLARLLAKHGVTVTIITTPLNVARFESIVDREAESGLRIQILRVPFPSVEVGLPAGCESVGALPSQDLLENLMFGISLLQEPVERILGELKPAPSCIISDKYLAWTHFTARKFGIPRLVFDGTSCFSLLCTHNILATKVHESLGDSEPFVVPGLPDQIVLTKGQLPNAVIKKDASNFRREIRETEEAAYGVVINTHEELESVYINEFRKVRGGKVWCIGPVSLCNRENSDMAERGNKASINGSHCLKWLDLQEPKSVVYACLGSHGRLRITQLIELGLGLEASNRPFIWVIHSKSEEMGQWLVKENFENRTQGRGLVIRGWAPQVLILSHKAVGAFLTHCGWNSTLEGICAGLPMITWPLSAEQFYNERFILQIVKIGVGVGVKRTVKWDEEDKSELLVTREKVKEAIEKLTEGEEGESRRERAEKLADAAKKAVEEGGSSHLNIRCLIQDIKQQVEK